MMSLQVLFLVLVLITLVLYAIHSKLQTTRREVKKVEEVKTPNKNMSFQYLEILECIQHIQENPAQINWEEWEEEEEYGHLCDVIDNLNLTPTHYEALDTNCPYCGSYSCCSILCEDCFTQILMKYDSDDADTCDDCASLNRECVSCISFALYEEKEKKEEDNILDEMYLLQEKLNKNKKELKKFKKRKPKYRKKINKELSFRELHIIHTFG